MIHLIIPFLQIDINEKIKNAPDDTYQTGIIIGTYLPFIAFAIIAWVVYYKAKNKKDLDD